MEICSVDGSKLQVNLQGDEQEVAEQVQSCPDCVAQNSITTAFNTNLTYQAPQTFALLSALFYQSPRPLTVWVSPPSAAPPVNA